VKALNTKNTIIHTANSVIVSD